MPQEKPSAAEPAADTLISNELFVQVAAHVASRAGYRIQALTEAAAAARGGAVRRDLIDDAVSELRWWDNSDGAAAVPDGHWLIAEALYHMGHNPDGGDLVEVADAGSYAYELLGRVARHVAGGDILATLVGDGAPLGMSVPAAALLDGITHADG